MVPTPSRRGLDASLQSPALWKSKLIYPAGAQPPPAQQQECNEVSQAGPLSALWAASSSGNQARVQPSSNQHSRGGGTPCCDPCLLLFVFCPCLLPHLQGPGILQRWTGFFSGREKSQQSLDCGFGAKLINLSAHSCNLNPLKTQTQRVALNVFIGQVL